MSFGKRAPFALRPVFALGLLMALGWPGMAAAQISIAPPEQVKMWRYATANFRGLDKITARINDFTADLDKPVEFGTLQILVRTCQKAPPEEKPKTTAYVEVREKDDKVPGLVGPPIFQGWMFAESPAINALEHPVYDFWLTDCSSFIEDEAADEEGSAKNAP